MERGINPSEVISGPEIYRSVYGDILKSPTSIMVNRVYQIPSGKQQEMLALAPNLDALVKDLGVTTSTVVPVMSLDRELMYINYRFSCLDHWGTAVDNMSSSKRFLTDLKSLLALLLLITPLIGALQKNLHKSR